MDPGAARRDRREVTPEEDVQLRRERAYRKVLEANREKFMNAPQLGDRDAARTGDVTFWRAWNGTAQHQASRFGQDSAIRGIKRLLGRLEDEDCR